MGGDGLWSNASELARLMRAVVSGRILTPESVKALSEPRFDSQDGDFTNLGWFTRVEPRHPRLLWIRGTEQNGFNAALYWYPDADLILAITTNLGPFERGLAHREPRARQSPGARAAPRRALRAPR